jgi:cytochrome c oxidase subunit IV
MLNEINAILSQAATRVTRSVAEFLPGLLALVVILVFTMAIAWVGRVMVRRSLQRIDFDKRVAQWGFSGLAELSPDSSPSRLAAGLSSLNVTLTSAFVVSVLSYLPNVFAAGLILVVGIIFARFAARGILISAVNLHIQWARLLSLGVKWLVIVLAGAMALEHLGIGGQIVRLGFGILFGGIVLALALAVGLGSKDMVSRSLERQTGKSVEEEESAGRFHHL